MSKEESSLRERQRQERADAILDAARELFAEQGYEAMTIDVLAARAGMTKPTVYAYFPTKEAIAVATVVRLIRRGLTELEGQDPALSALARLEKVVRWALHEKFVLRRGIVASAPIPAIRAHPDYQAAHNELVRRLAALVDAGKAEGTVDTALSTPVALRVFISVLRDTEYDDLRRGGAVSAEELVETLATFLLHGLRART